MEKIQETAGRMMKTFASTFLMLAVSGLMVGAQEESPQLSFGERGSGQSVFDPTGVLSSRQMREINQPLRVIHAKESIDVVVLVLPNIGDAPPDHVAKAFADQWSVAKINAVVMHVPGREDSPWIIPGDFIVQLIKPDPLKEAIDTAQGRAAAEPSDFDKVRAASIEATDLVRHWTGGAILRTEDVINRRLEMQLAHERRQRLIKLSGAIALAALIPLIAGAYMLFAGIAKNRPRHFPTVRKSPRLGAPYSGGNSNFSKPIR